MFLKFLWLCLFSQRGEGEENITNTGSSEDSDTSQGDQDTSSNQDSQVEGQTYTDGTQDDGTLADLTSKYTQLQEQYEVLKGQATATERNLSSERKALESIGMKMVRDHEGNIQVVPIAKTGGKSRFTDDHRTKFSSYFPDEDSAKNYLSLMDAYMEDFFESRISNYDKKLTERQQFQLLQTQSNQRMLDLYPSLDINGNTYNESFYKKATEIWESNYRNLPNGELIAANEAAIEMGISPQKIIEAKKTGYQQGKTSRTIVSSSQGTQSGASSGKFKRLSFEEYSKLTPEQKDKYDNEEVLSRRKE